MILKTVININYKTSSKKMGRFPVKSRAQIHELAGHHIQDIRINPAAPESRRAVSLCNKK